MRPKAFKAFKAMVKAINGMAKTTKAIVKVLKAIFKARPWSRPLMLLTRLAIKVIKPS